MNVFKCGKIHTIGRINSIKGTKLVWESDIERGTGHESSWKEARMSEYDETQQCIAKHWKKGLWLNGEAGGGQE